MKIFLDLSAKTIQIIDGIGFDELDELKKFLGEDYKSWKIEPTAEPLTIRVKDNQPFNPITFPTPSSPSLPYQPFQPYYQTPTITVGTTGVTTVTSGSPGITTVTSLPSGCNDIGTTVFNNIGTFTSSSLLNEIGQN